MSVLVTFATKHGATAEIAEKIGEILNENSLHADVMDINQVRNLESYSAIIVGSPVYYGDWRYDVVNFLEENLEILKTQDVWIFSSGPTGERDEFEILAEWRFPHWLRPLVERIQPEEVVVFFGNLEAEKLNFLEKGLAKLQKIPFGDFRDWDKIKDWALTIVHKLNVSG